MTSAERATRCGFVHCAGITAAIVLLVLTPAFARPSEADAAVDQVKALVDAGHYSDAILRVKEAEKTVTDARAVFELQFLKGAAAQHLAGDGTQPEAVRSQAFAQAQAAYKRASQLRPTSLATLNNLAALNASMGRDQVASDYYQQVTTRAAASRDPMLETYAFNFAKFLQARNKDEAIRFALIAVETPNSGGESRDLLADLYARYQPESLLLFARRLLDEGRIGKVRELAIGSIKTDSLAPTLRRDWFSLLALTMARDALGQIAYDPGPTLAELNALSAADALDPAARQLAQAVKDPPGTAAPLAWWRSGETSDAVLVAPREAMRELLISLGQRSIQFSPVNPEIAARYFLTAMEFGKRGIDPDAFLGLVDVYADSGKIGSLAELLDRYESQLFRQKGGAYAAGDWPQIFRFHTALGMTYAYLRIWNSQSPFQNALFQLENAKKAADVLNDLARGAGQPARYALPPAAVRKLSEGYEAVGRAKDAVRIRVESADMLLTVGREKESADLVKSVLTSEIDTMNEQTRATYERLRALEASTQRRSERERDKEETKAPDRPNPPDDVSRILQERIHDATSPDRAEDR